MINILLYQIVAFSIHRKILEKSYKNSKFEISAPISNEGFKLPDGSYFVSDIHGYFKYILKHMR